MKYYETYYKKIIEANKSLQVIKSYLLDLDKKGLFNYMDLKLYDAFFFACDNKIIEDFYFFCDSQYDQFLEDLKEAYSIDFEDNITRVGRTSKFYCFKNDNIILNNYRLETNVNVADSIDNLFNDYFNGYNYLTWLNFNSKGFIDATKTMEDIKSSEYYEISEIMPDAIKELNYIIDGSFLNDIKEAFNDSIIIFDYIKSFKENQVDHFKDFLECNNINFLEVV